MAQHTVRISPGSFPPDEERTLLPEGRYLARIADAELFNSSLKGTPGIRVNMRIMAPPQHKGEKIMDSLWLTPAAGRMLTAKLAAAGMQFGGEDFDLDLDDLVSRVVIINVKHRVFEEVVYAQISNWKHYVAPANDVAPAEIAKAPEPESAAPESDEDIPF